MFWGQSYLLQIVGSRKLYVLLNLVSTDCQWTRKKIYYGQGTHWNAQISSLEIISWKIYDWESKKSCFSLIVHFVSWVVEWTLIDHLWTRYTWYVFFLQCLLLLYLHLLFIYYQYYTKNANTCNAQTQLTHRNDKKLSIIYIVSIFFIICWNWASFSFLWCFWKDIIVNPFFSQNCHKICYNGVICNLFNCENHFSLFKKFLIEWNMSIISAHCVFCDFKVIAKKV